MVSDEGYDLTLRDTGTGSRLVVRESDSVDLLRVSGDGTRLGYLGADGAWHEVDLPAPMMGARPC